MKINTMWRSNKSTQKAKRVRHKPKIRWQQLGLTDPAEDNPSISMDEIRRQVLMASSRGLGQGARSSTEVKSGGVNGRNNSAEPGHKRRRGATE